MVTWVYGLGHSWTLISIQGWKGLKGQSLSLFQGQHYDQRGWGFKAKAGSVAMRRP